MNTNILYPIIIVSDIHGHVDNLNKLLSLYPISPINSLGDIVNLWDKNQTNNNQKIIDLFISNKKRLISLRGNHDEYVGANPSVYGLDSEKAKYLLSLPITLSIQIGSTVYKFYHYRPNDYWSTNYSDNLSHKVFCESYGYNQDANYIIIGHVHRYSRIEYLNDKRVLISIGALKDGYYGILTDEGIEHKQLL